MRVRISFADSTRRNNRYRRSFGWIHPTNETNLFALWFSFFTHEQRPFYHDKKVNIKPGKPPSSKKPLTVLRAGSCVLSHCEQFRAESSMNNKICWNSYEHDTNNWFQYCIFHYMSDRVKCSVIEMQCQKSSLLKLNNLLMLLPTCFIELFLLRLLLLFFF